MRLVEEGTTMLGNLGAIEPRLPRFSYFRANSGELRQRLSVADGPHNAHLNVAWRVLLYMYNDRRLNTECRRIFLFDQSSTTDLPLAGITRSLC